MPFSVLLCLVASIFSSGTKGPETTNNWPSSELSTSRLWLLMLSVGRDPCCLVKYPKSLIYPRIKYAVTASVQREHNCASSALPRYKIILECVVCEDYPSENWITESEIRIDVSVVYLCLSIIEPSQSRLTRSPI